MTREEVIRLAAESEVITGIIGRFIFKDIEHLTRFAELVAAAEREACAVVCLTIPVKHPEIAYSCATLIRARGDVK